MSKIAIDICWAAPTGDEERVVSSVRVYLSPLHAHVRIWNRGGYAGELTVERGDWPELVRLLGFAAPSVSVKSES